MLNLSLISSEIHNKGYFVAEEIIDKDFIEKVKNEVNKENRKRGEKNWELNSVRLLSLLYKDKIFLKLFKNEQIHKIVSKLLGDKYIYSFFSANTVYSSTSSINFHRDHPTQLGSNIFKSVNNNYLLSVQLIILLDDFDLENGATLVIPHSHKKDISNNEIKNTQKDIIKHAKSIVAKKGSILIYDPNLLHSSGINKTNNSRSVIILSFCQPFIRTQENIGIHSGNFLNESESFKEMIGYKLPKQQVSQTHIHKGNFFLPLKLRIKKIIKNILRISK